MPSNDVPPSDPTTAFAGRMLEMVNHASLLQLVSVGRRNGLLDAIAGFRPSTSREIADAVGIGEPYVRDWLLALAANGVVGHDRAMDTFWLDQDRADLLISAVDACVNIVAPSLGPFPAGDINGVRLISTDAAVPGLRNRDRVA
ncbi:MAG: hypothetical protein CMJ31_02625 [Phycisphaerae bacterium]|nr:hypothetical protein [Phycisphaerae bacterium]